MAASNFAFASGVPMSHISAAFESRISIPPALQRELRFLWVYYQRGDINKLEQVAQNYSNLYPFLLPAVQAHLQRVGSNGAGNPEKVIRNIMIELNTTEFGPVFREFCKREPIYGFGDLQVERLWRQILNNQ